MSCICLGVQFTVPGTSLKGPQWYKPELSAECVCPSGALPFSWASVHWHQWESLGFLCSVFLQKQVLKTAYHKLKLLPPLWFSHLMWCPQLPEEMPLFTHSNRWSHIPAASCCAWVFFLVVCSSCRPEGLKIPSCQGAEQGRPRLLQESSALARSAAFSLQRSACVSVCQGSLVQTSAAATASAPVRSRFLPALLAASRGAQWLEAPMRPLRVENRAAPAFSVVPVGHLCLRRTRFHPRLLGITVPQPCIRVCYLHFCLVNNLQCLLGGILLISKANEAVAAWQTGAIIYTSSLQEKKGYKRKKES